MRARSPLPRRLTLVLSALLLPAACWRPTPLTATAPVYEAPPPEPTRQAEATPREHAIRFHRPAQVGQYHSLVIDVEETILSVGTDGGRVAMRESRARGVHVAAVRRVLEVDPAGLVTRGRYEVSEAIERTADGPRVLVEPGQVLRVDQTREGGSLSLEDAELPAESVAGLELAFGTRLVHRANDAVLGIGRPQSIDAEWPIDTEALAAEYAAIGELTFRPDDADGHTLVDRVEPVDGVPCVWTQSELTAAPIQMLDLSAFPEGTEARSGSVQASYVTALPFDPALPVLDERLTLVIHLSTVTPVSRRQTLEVQSEIRRTRAVQLRPLAR